MKIKRGFLICCFMVSALGFAAEPETEFVDLGLSSGKLWATSNIGAKSAEEAGTYYAWGEWSKDVNIPTAADVEELQSACDWSYETLNGKTVACAKSKANGNKIYFPFSGYKMQEVKNAEHFGSIWTSSEGENGTAFYFLYYNVETLPNHDTTYVGGSAKTKGRNVRAVKTSK